MTILTRLPEDYHENTLAIRSSLQSVRFYVDGELRMEYDTSGTRLVGKNSASCYVFCPTSEDDAGKEVRIELTTNTAKYSGVVNTVYCGDEAAIWGYLFQTYGLETVIALFLLFAGIITIIFGFSLGIAYQTKFDMEYLGWCVFMFKRFRDDMKKYWKYAIYSSKAQLKAEVANSYLNWLWWVLDPLCFMLIYVFMFGYVFKSKEQYFAIFVFVGITLWDFFNKCLLQSVKIIKNNKPIVSKVYIPKFILLVIRICVNGFKMCISLLIIVAMLAIWRVPLTLNILYVIPILITLVTVVFGISCFLLHYGVFVEDLGNVLRIALRLVFYLTGVFWNIMSRLPAPYNSYIGKGNPIAFLITSMRQCVIYGQAPHRKLLLLWFLIGLVLCALGIRKIYKSENSYVKVI